MSQDISDKTIQALNAACDDFCAAMVDLVETFAQALNRLYDEFLDEKRWFSADYRREARDHHMTAWEYFSFQLEEVLIEAQLEKQEQRRRGK